MFATPWRSVNCKLEFLHFSFICIHPVCSNFCVGHDLRAFAFGPLGCHFFFSRRMDDDRELRVLSGSIIGIIMLLRLYCLVTFAGT